MIIHGQKLFSRALRARTDLGAPGILKDVNTIDLTNQHATAFDSNTIN